MEAGWWKDEEKFSFRVLDFISREHLDVILKLWGTDGD
jgi:hypothetical protein